MKKYINIICAFALCIILCLYFVSCSDKSNINYEDDSYLEWVENGKKDIFVSLCEASSSQKKILTYGKTLETKDFSLALTDTQNSNGCYLNYELTLNNFTIDEGNEERNIYIGIYSLSSGMYSLSNNDDWNKIVSDYSEFYMHAIIADNYNFGDYTSKSSFRLYDDQKHVVIIIVVDGNLYNIVYMLNK